MSAEIKILCNRVSGYVEPFCYVQHHITSEIHWLLLPKGKLCQEGVYAWITRAVTINSFMVDHAIHCNPANRCPLVQLKKEMIPSYWITSHGVSPALLSSVRSGLPSLTSSFAGSGSSGFARTSHFSYTGMQERGLWPSKGTPYCRAAGTTRPPWLAPLPTSG